MARPVVWLPRTTIQLPPDPAERLDTVVVGTAAAGYTPIRTVVRLQITMLVDARTPNPRRLREIPAALGVYWTGGFEFPGGPVAPWSDPDETDWMWWQVLTWEPDWEPDYVGGPARLWAYRSRSFIDVAVSRGPFTAEANEIRIGWEVGDLEVQPWVGVYGSGEVLARAPA